MSYDQIWGSVVVWLLVQIRWYWWGRDGYLMWFLVLCCGSITALYPALGERAVSVALTWTAAVVLTHAVMARALAFTAWCDHIRHEDPEEIAEKLHVRYWVHLRALDTLELTIGIVVMAALIGPYNNT